MGRYLADYMLRALLFHVVKTFRLERPTGESLQQILNDDMTAWVRTPRIKLRCEFRRREVNPVSD